MLDELFAIACVAFGLLTLGLRLVAPERLGSLYRIEERLGPRPGRVVHFTVYTVIPLGFGVFELVRLSR